MPPRTAIMARMADSRNHHDRGSSVRSLDAETVLDRHARDIARWCLHILRDPHDAEDCAQEAMVRIYEHAATFRGEAPVSAWVYEVTRTTCLKWLRSQRRRREATSALETPTEPATAPSPFESLADRERRNRPCRAGPRAPGSGSGWHRRTP